VFGGDIDITTIFGIYNVSLSMYVVSKGQFSQTSTDVVEVMVERNTYMLHNSELDRGHCDVLYCLKKTRS
jgi:hypothetical protein